MDIIIAVEGQRLRPVTNLKSLVSGTQEFIKFIFTLDSDWATLTPTNGSNNHTFAQFVQDGNAYNAFLDRNYSVYLPSEITEGTCTLMLYSTSGTVKATSNYLTLTINENNLVADASSTEITQSLYDQLVEMVNSIIDISDSDYSDLIVSQVNSIMADYLENGDIAAMTIGDGTLTYAKMNSSVKASLDKADNSWQKNQGANAASITAGSWEATYDTSLRQTDVYAYANAMDDNVISALDGTTTTSRNAITFTVDNTNYAGITNAINGALTKAKSYTQAQLADYSPFDVVIVNTLPAAGAERTFYLIPKESGNGYDKYWYIQDESENYIWDNFGSTSTVVVDSLPVTGDVDVDYIVSTDAGYLYYKYIDGNWELIAGSSAEIINPSYTIDITGYGTPADNNLDPADYNTKHYLNLTNLQPYISNGTAWSTVGSVLAPASTLSDYYIIDANGSYIHYRYINNRYEAIGTDTYTQEEIQDLIDSSIDDMLNDGSGTGIDDRLTDVESDVSSIQTELANMANFVETVTISNDKTTLTITYADGSFTTITLDTGTDIDAARYNENDDYYLRFYDSNGNELEDLAVYIQGGGGGGASTGGSASIDRIGDKDLQVVFGDSCVIGYSVIAVDSNNDSVGSGIGTLYINNIPVETGFTVYTSDTGAANSIDVGSYLAVGNNTVKISVSVDTGGETNTVATKTWGVTAINMYLVWNYTDSQVNTSAVTDYFTPYGDLSKVVYTFLDVDPMTFNPKIVTELPASNDDDFDATANYFVYESGSYVHYVWNSNNNAYALGTGSLIGALSTTRSGVQYSMSIPAQSHGSHYVVRYIIGSLDNGGKIETAQQVHDMIFVTAGNTDPIISTSFNTPTMTQYNTAQIPIVVYDPSRTTTTVYLYEDGVLVSTWTNVDRTVHYWNYAPTTYGNKTLEIVCGSTTKTLNITVEELDIDEEEVTGYDFRFKASELATNSAAENWSATYIPVGSSTPSTVDITFSNNFDWVNGGLHTEEDESGNLRQYFCVRAGTTMTFNYNLFGRTYDPKQYGKNFKFIFKAVNCRTYDANVLSCMDTSLGNNGVGLVMTANEATFTTVNESLTTYYCKDSYVEFEVNIHPNSEYPYLQFWMDGSHDRNILYSNDDSMQQNTPVGITVGSPNCDVYIYMMKAYPIYMTNNNEISNFIMDAPNAYEMVDRYDRNDVLNASGEIDYEKLAAQNPDLRVLLLDLNRMSTGKKDNVVAYSVRQIYNAGGQSHCFTINNACVTIQGTSSVGYLESAGNVDINFKYNRTFTSDNVSYTTSAISFDNGSTSTSGYSMTDDSIAVDYLNVKLNVASSENANNACIADWYNTYQPWTSPARKKNDKARDTIEFTPGVIFIRDRSGNLFGDTTGYHMYGICDIGNSKKNTNVFHDTTNKIACCVEVANNTSAPCLMSSNTYTWDDDEAFVTEGGEQQKVFEFRYVDDDSLGIAESAWDRFVKFMTDYNPNNATGNSLGSSVTFSAYTFKGSGSYDTSAYDSDNYTVVYLYGYGLPTAYNGGIYSASTYRTSTVADGTCYYYINYSNDHIYSSNGTTWTSIGTLTWTADRNNVLAGTTVSTYAGTYTQDTFNYRMAYLLEHCEEYMVVDPVFYHFVFIESYLMTDNVAKNTFWSSDDLVHWEPSKDYDNDTALGNDRFCRCKTSSNTRRNS